MGICLGAASRASAAAAISATKLLPSVLTPAPPFQIRDSFSSYTATPMPEFGLVDLASVEPSVKTLMPEGCRARIDAARDDLSLRRGFGCWGSE